VCIADPGTGCQVFGMKIIYIIFCVNYLYYLHKRDMDARFLGRWVYPRARESNFFASDKNHNSVVPYAAGFCFKTAEY